MILQVKDAISAEDCRRLIAIYDRHVPLTKVRDYTGHPVVYWDQLRDTPEAAEIVPRLVEECLRHTSDRLELESPLYPETVVLAAIGPGGHHSRHADNCRQNEQGEWVANHTPQRHISAIYYLNEEFDGGEILFEQTQLTVKPRRGLLLAFPSEADHVHKVLPVRSGVRYTMPIWFTKQQGCALSMGSLGLPRSEIGGPPPVSRRSRLNPTGISDTWHQNLGPLYPAPHEVALVPTATACLNERLK